MATSRVYAAARTQVADDDNGQSGDTEQNTKDDDQVEEHAGLGH
jgi:hypothetical protein